MKEGREMEERVWNGVERLNIMVNCGKNISLIHMPVDDLSSNGQQDQDCAISITPFAFSLSGTLALTPFVQRTMGP